MLLLFTDVETTGLDKQVDRITELGAVLWCTERSAPVEILSELINFPDRPIITDEITGLTGIDEKLLVYHANDNPVEVLKRFYIMAKKAEYIVAHNAPFDKGFINAAFELLGSKNMGRVEAWSWIDTMLDINYGASMKSRKQGYIAADLGINPNAFAHRALFDCLQLIEIFNKYPLAEITERAASPNLTIEAEILAPWDDPKPDGKKDKDVAKSLGFYYTQDTKTWRKNIKEIAFNKDDFPFKVKVHKDN